MIEKIRADFLGRIEEFPSLPFVVRRQLGIGAPTAPEAHAPHRQTGYFEISVRDFHHFHRNAPLPIRVDTSLTSAFLPNTSLLLRRARVCRSVWLQRPA